jgi:hypothetical protein
VIGVVETAKHTSVATMGPLELRGSSFGLLAAIQSAGDFVASVTVGVIRTLVSPTAAFAVAAVVVAAGGVSASDLGTDDRGRPPEWRLIRSPIALCAQLVPGCALDSSRNRTEIAVLHTHIVARET